MLRMQHFITVKCEVNKYTYFLENIPVMKDFFKPLDDLIGNIFFLTLLQTIFTDQDRQLYSLPVKVAV